MISPDDIRPGGEGTNLIADNDVTDFPEPDSPTTPIVSPLFNVKLMLSTARTVLPSA